MLQRELLYAALGTGFTCGATILGAAMVFFFKKDISHTIQKVFLGFAAGVMIAASVWSLLIPAMEMAESQGQNVMLPVGGGFVLGGVFLMLLAGYFFLFSERITLSGNRKTAAVCFALSGTTSGLFGIGGPLMALYFVATSKNKESYIANVQFVFAVTGIGNFLTRVVKGVYTVDLIPATLLGFLGILIGKAIGLKILDRLDLKRMKQCVYAFVGISGFITVAEHFLR